MRSSIAALGLGLALLAPPLPTRADTNTTPAWPATRPGELARGWVTAFNGGEKAMQDFLATRMAVKALGERPVRVRVERYRELRETYGRLQLERVVKSEPYALTVKLVDADARSREWVFQSEERAPWKLASVSIKEPHFLHGFGGVHGH